MGKVGDLSQAYLEIGSAKLMWGNFVSVLIDFLVVAFVIYFVFKKLGIEKLDKNSRLDEARQGNMFIEDWSPWSTSADLRRLWR
jgi:large-conductance mechanosensitive channel